MNATWIILTKEVKELLRSRALLLSMFSFPTTVVVVPVIVVAYLVEAAPAASIAFIQTIYDLPGEGTIELLVQAAAMNWLPVFLLMPMFLPILIAAQSIGGERERRTLEPLLATPISTTSIVLGKSLAAVVPALGITWIAAAVFIVSLNMIAGAAILPDLPWVFAVLVLSPLLALFGNATAVAVSARVTDPRAAQNIAGMTVVPLLGVMVAQLVGSVRLGMPFYLWFAVVLVLLDTVMVWVAARMFDRERLLTRW